MVQLPGPPEGGLWAELSGAYRRLYERLTVKGPSTKSTVPPHILPGVRLVTDLDELLKVLDIDLTTTGGLGVGTSTVRTVPADERWTLYGYHVSRSAGDRNSTALVLLDTGGHSLTLATWAAAQSDATQLPHPVPLDRGWALQLAVSGGTTDGAWVVRFLVAKEKAY